MGKISIVIPAYNEEAYIGKLLELIVKVPTEKLGFTKEIIVVDDGSKDRTYDIAKSVNNVKVIKQKNQGKGCAVQTGIRESTGDYILVQDADLEYFPKDYIPMLEKLKEGKPLTAIYGSRTLGVTKKSGFLKLFQGKHPKQNFGPWLAGVILSIWTFLLYGELITDTLTAYKLYPSDIIKNFDIKTHGFETDHELTSKLIKSNIAIKEVPIDYDPRTAEEGKKIGPKDGVIAMWTLLKYRFVN